MREATRAELRPGVKLAAFGAALAATFALGWGIGAAVDPVIEPKPHPPAEVHPEHEP